MNLIEQLGGYEKAKKYLESLKKVPMHEQTEDTISYLPDMLLEHRRQHNIFEVGDSFVSDFYKLDTVFFVTHSNMDEKYVYSNKGITNKTFKGECRFLFNEIRHATDAEIEAGKRLEVV